MKYFKDSEFVIEVFVLMALISGTYWFFRILAILMIKEVFV